MKVQINSLEAFNRLIEGDKEMEISIKSAIINDFATRYIKSVANSEIIDKVKQEVLKAIEKTDYFGMLREVDTSSWFKDHRLSHKVEKLVEEEVKSKVYNIIFDKVAEAEARLEEVINQRLESMSNFIIGRLGEEAIKNALTRILQEKLKKVV
jgi:hypothetical protein